MEQIDKFSFSTMGMKPKTNYCSKHKLTMRYRDVHPIKDRFMIAKNFIIWEVRKKTKAGSLILLHQTKPLFDLNSRSNCIRTSQTVA
uniref:Uncharacterized protein n=1 Tax=Populus tomentosa TaxID=118781 RepID=A0A1L6K5Y6_POPTO|nr:hypothetical protein [Populus tomentosa]